MVLYPKSISVDEEQIKRLTNTYQQAYLDIYSEIATSTALGQVRRKQILSQVEGILTELGTDTHKFISDNIPDYYKSGANDAVRQLKAINAPIEIKTGFNRVHRAAISALVDDAATAFGESLSGVNRSARQLMSKATKDSMTQELATGNISGEAKRKIKQQLMGTLQEQGLDALVDKGGNGWTLDRYTEMLVRTKFVEARNMGLKNRLVENNYDLVQVSSHGADDVCGDWEGKILSLTGETTELDGEEIATVDEAEADGLFHPNCKHAINALTLDLAQDTMGWNADTQEYEQGMIDQQD